MSSKNYEATGYGHDLDFADHLALIACFISYEKWVQREKYSSKARPPYSSTR